MGHTGPVTGNLYFYYCFRRSRWPSGQRSRSAADRLLRLWVRTPPGTWKFVCSECCVLSVRGLCVGLITRPEESYRLWRVVVCDLETSWVRRHSPSAPKTNYCFQWRKYLFWRCTKLVTNISFLHFFFLLKRLETCLLYLNEERPFSVIRFRGQRHLQWVTALAVKNNKEMAVTTEKRWRQFAVARRGMCCAKRGFATTDKATLTEHRAYSIFAIWSPVLTAQWHWAMDS